MPRAFSQLTFTPAVRAHQERIGSARSYAKFIEGGPQQGHEIGPAEQAFIEARDDFSTALGSLSRFSRHSAMVQPAGR